MKLKILLPVIALFFFSTARLSARENKDLMRAEYYYAHYAYFEAIPWYEKLAGVNDPKIFAHLADCYSATGDFQKAISNYEKAVHIGGCSVDVMLRFAQILMQQQQYREAAVWLSKHREAQPEDRRTAHLLAACNSAPQRMAEVPSGTATLTAFNTDGSEFAPAIWKGKLVFASDTAIDIKKKTDKWTGNSYYNIYCLPCDMRGNCGREWNILADTRQLNNKYHNGPCTFSADGREMWYTRSRFRNSWIQKKSVASKDSTVLLEIMIAENFDTASRKFRTIRPFQYNSKEYSVAHPSVSPDGKVVIFSSTQPGGSGGADLYYCLRTGEGWSKPVNAGASLNTEGEEVFPYWADDTTLFFSSDGHEGLGGLDIYKTKWNRQAETFTIPENIGLPVNSSYDDISLAMFADGRSTYFSSNRPAARGSDNIYFFKREVIYLKLKVIDSVSGQPVSNAGVSLRAVPGSLDTLSDANGELMMRLFPETRYSIRISKSSYYPQQAETDAMSDKETDTVYRLVRLVHPVEVPVVTKPDTPSVTSGISFTHIVGKPEVNKIYEIGHFYFAYNSAELNDTAKVILDSLNDFLTSNRTMRIQVRAHTDCRGGDAFNLKLSDARALSVVRYLVRKGIAEKRLTYIGLGLREPKIPCPVCEQCSELEYYLNRVLEFKILEL